MPSTDLCITALGRGSKAAPATAEGAWVTLRFASRSFPEVEAAFPFPFQAEYTYRLKDGALANEFTATNVGDAPMPMGFGVHPWFPAPLSTKGAVAIVR